MWITEATPQCFLPLRRLAPRCSPFFTFCSIRPGLRSSLGLMPLPAPSTSVSDDWVDSTIDTVICSLTEAQAERLALALSVRIEELHEAAQVIEGEAA